TLTLLPHPGGVQLDVGTGPAAVVLVPGPIDLGAKGPARLQVGREADTGVLGGPLDGGLAEAHARHFGHQLGTLLEAVGDGTRQGGDTLQSRAEIPGRQAGLPIEGEQALAAAAAQVVGALVGDGANEAGRRVRAVAVGLGRGVRGGTGYAGALVGVFFRARCCARALAAIVWARARSLNSVGPKGWVSSVATRVRASSSISAAASRMAWARAWTSASFSGGMGVAGRGRGPPAGGGFSPPLPAPACRGKIDPL